MTTTDQRSEAHRAIFAEDYLRTRYGAYKAHPAWRELEDAFNAGLDAPCNIVYGDGVAIDLDAMRLRLELAESVTMPKANAVTLLYEIERLRRLAEENERLKAQIAAPRVTADMWKELVVAQNTLLSVQNSRTEREARLNADPQPAAPTQVEVQGWQPIETAPGNMDSLVAVMWLDSDGPVCHDLDYTQDGVWQKWYEHAEHVEVIGGHGVSYTPPYTHWMPLPAAPSQGEKP